jgi:hypothetical protein
MALHTAGGAKPRRLREHGGFWWYLVVRLQGRTLERLEQLRNEATAKTIQMLPPGAELEEYETHGRYRRIRIPVLITVVPCPRSESLSSQRDLAQQGHQWNTFHRCQGEVI